MTVHSTESPPEPSSPSSPPADETRLKGRIAAWALMTGGWLAFLVLGSVSVISYTYNGFLGKTFKEVGDKSLLDIWRYQVGHLPEYFNQTLLETMFVASLVVLLIGGIYGAWLLVVRSPGESSRTGSRNVWHPSDT